MILKSRTLRLAVCVSKEISTGAVSGDILMGYFSDSVALLLEFKSWSYVRMGKK